MKTIFRAIFLQARELHHSFVPHVSEHIVAFDVLWKIFPLNYILQVVAACAILHNNCLCASDIVVPEEEPEKDVRYEGEAGLEAINGVLWRDQLSAEVSALEENNYC